jgi:hypothetical protein
MTEIAGQARNDIFLCHAGLDPNTRGLPTFLERRQSAKIDVGKNVNLNGKEKSHERDYTSRR